MANDTPFKPFDFVNYEGLGLELAEYSSDKCEIYISGAGLREGLTLDGKIALFLVAIGREGIEFTAEGLANAIPSKPVKTIMGWVGGLMTENLIKVGSRIELTASALGAKYAGITVRKSSAYEP